jgi:hypothetical protein
MLRESPFVDATAKFIAPRLLRVRKIQVGLQKLGLFEHAFRDKGMGLL